MRLPAIIAAVLLILALAAALVPPPARGAETTPTLGYAVYLPAVEAPPPTAAPTATNTPTPTPTSTPTATPAPPLEWDWRLDFLRIQLTRATGSPRWSVTKGVFQDWNEGNGGIGIFVDVLDQNGARLDLSEGTEIGMVLWPSGSTPLTWGGKGPDEYPVNFAMSGDGGLGSYTIWLTLDNLASDQLAGMGLVATDDDGNLIPQPGRVHCNYLFTFRRVGP